MFASTVVLISPSPDGDLEEALRSVVLRVPGCEFESATSEDVLQRRIPLDRLGLILLHVRQPNEAEAARSLLRTIHDFGWSVPVVVIADEHDLNLSLSFIQAGAVDCLFRPLDLTRLRMLVDILTVRGRLKHGSHKPAHHVPAAAEEFDLCSGSSAMARLMHDVRRVAPRDASILFYGETGTGKTRLARIVHELSPRKAEPFLVVNCATLSPSLVESELFGHVKGAFTGADRQRVGKLTAVGAGTLLLDDVDALSLESQARLLRAIDERVFEPVGSNETEAVKARFIVASNRCLQSEVGAGRFRADLFYRINVIQFYLPPLRERREEIMEIAGHFLQQHMVSCGRPIAALDAEVIHALEQYAWPGNIRELRNVIERAVALCADGQIRVSDLPEALRQGASASPASPTGLTSDSAAPVSPQDSALSPLGAARMNAEIQRIRSALEKHNNNRKRAAEELRISRTALYKKLRQYGMMKSA